MSSRYVYLTPGATVGVPGLGCGYDDIDARSYAQAIDMASEITPNDLCNCEVIDLRNSSENVTDNTVDASWKSTVSGSFGFSSFEQLSQSSTLFLIIGYAVVKTSKINDGSRPQLKAGKLAEAQNDPAAFLRKYGYYYVDGIDYGGAIMLTYLFETRDSTTRASIGIALNDAMVGNASVKESLTQHGVSSAMKAQMKVWGGEPSAVHFDPNLGIKMFHEVSEWKKTIVNPAPMRIHVVPYNDTFENPFPDLGSLIE